MASDRIKITVEHVGTADRLQVQDNGDGQYTVVDKEVDSGADNAQLATIHFTDEGRSVVDLYLGKGGFCAIVTTQNAKYFGLGDAQITLPDMTVKLLGQHVEKQAQPLSNKFSGTYATQNQTPQAMILGAGLATRFAPISGDHSQRSKPDVFLNGHQTVIQLIANGLARAGFTNLFVNTFYKPHSLKASLAKSDADSIQYVDEAAPSGTAGALRKILQDPSQYNFDNTKPILVVQGDAVTDVDLSTMMTAHSNNNALATIGCQQVADDQVHRFGIVETDQSDDDGVSGAIDSFVEKPQPSETTSRLANTGFYLFSPESYPLLLQAYNNLPADVRDKELDFANHVFPVILAAAKESNNQTPFWAQRVTGYWSDIGNPAQYLETAYDVFSGRMNLPLPEPVSDFIEGPVLYWPDGKKAAQQDGAVLTGNVIVAVPFKN